MKRTLCYCSPAYGALMHALPRDASALKRMTEKQMITQATPWVNRVPPATEHALDTWTVKAINPQAKGLGDLGDLSELSGMGKKLKKVAKKIAKPLAYAIGGATGTLAFVAKADKLRTAARKVRAAVKGKPQEAAPQEQEQADPEAPMQEQQQQAWQQAQASFQPAAPVYQPQSFVSTRPPEYSNPIQRMQPTPDEDKPKIVGLSAAGIMDSIKANPLPWGAGLGLAVYLITRRPAHQNQRAY